MIYVDFESILLQKNNGYLNQMNLIQRNMKIKFLPVMAMIQYVLIINLVSFLNHTEAKFQFTVFLIP